jgi:L-threonylcarbamoyladenylate synthase
MKILKECNLSEVAVELLAGKTLIFPTETSYGLGCDATNQQAVDSFLKSKLEMKASLFWLWCQLLRWQKDI